MRSAFNIQPINHENLTSFSLRARHRLLLGAVRPDPRESPPGRLHRLSFKPYVGIGLAYLVIAIAGGLIAMKVIGKDNFKFNDAVTKWGFAAGTLGALGALSLTLAMFNGGARIPHAVMPVVFGGAVTITALYSIFRRVVRSKVARCCGWESSAWACAPC